MTGFARAQGVAGAYAWSWELKSVNAKGLELRLRLPPGWDAVEVPVRTHAAAKLARGNVYGNMTVKREGVAPVVRVNEQVLAAVLSTMQGLAGRLDADPPRLDGVLGIKGVIDVTDEDENEDARQAAETAIIAGFSSALEELSKMRKHEGEALGRLLSTRLEEIETLAGRAEKAPGRQPDSIKKKLADQIAVLLESSNRFDADRLHQEAILIASKADVREELDRLAAHVAQARHLLERGGAVGRRLDFLSQELHRESNTLCAKANDLELSNIGLELKTVVEQFREQVQNLE
jgi:uncharacterized protein (TIGR00255 family)